MYDCVGPSTWRPAPVYELALWTNGLAFKDIDFSDFGRPIIKIAELKNGVTSQTAHTQAEYDPSVFVRSGDLLFSWSGNPDTSIDVFRWEGQDGWLNQHIFKVKPKPGISEEFLFFLLRWLRPRFAEIARNKQTTGLGHVTIQDLKRMIVGVPEGKEQDGIVDIVGPLRKKIDLNRRTNATLEAMAQAIFKDWFVDFGPVGSKAAHQPSYLPKPTWALFPSALDSEGRPHTWHERSLYGIAEFVNGAAYKDMHFSAERDGFPVIKIAELKNGVTPNTKFTTTDLGSKYRIDTLEILFSWSGNPDTSIDTFIWDEGPAYLNQHIFRVRENGSASRAMIYFQLKQLKPTFAEIARNKQTTGLGHVTAADMKALMVCAPPAAIANAFEEIVAPMFEEMCSNLLENRALETLSDFLLPKLMSGEIRVKDAGRMVEAAL